MSEFPISKSPFLRSAIIERDYAAGNFNAKTEEVPVVEKTVIKPVNAPPPPPLIDTPPPPPVAEFQNDPVPEFAFSEPEPSFGGETMDSNDDYSEEEKISTQQAKDTASMVVLIFNQIVTALGQRFCTIDIESIEANVTSGNIDRYLADAVVAANERSKEKLSFSVEHQKELIRAITIILKNGNFSGISPTMAAVISIITVCGVHLMGLIEVAKANTKCVAEAIENSKRFKNSKEDSNIPVEQVVIKAKPPVQQKENQGKRVKTM